MKDVCRTLNLKGEKMIETFLTQCGKVELNFQAQLAYFAQQDWESPLYKVGGYWHCQDMWGTEYRLTNTLKPIRQIPIMT
jgi:hypothetical protein